jgi:hypothetical protein
LEYIRKSDDQHHYLSSAIHSNTSIHIRFTNILFNMKFFATIAALAVAAVAAPVAEADAEASSPMLVRYLR